MQAQQGTSLADTARQLRAQKQPGQDQTAPSRAQELADQMQQEQDDAGNAPPGFKTYTAGDYQLRIPAPFNLEGATTAAPC